MLVIDNEIGKKMRSNLIKPTIRMTAKEVSSICREVFALGVVEPLLGKRRDRQVDISDDVRVTCKLRPSEWALILFERLEKGS